jgi:hypothetical protein
MSLPPSAGRYSFENLDTLLYVCASSLETSSKVEKPFRCGSLGQTGVNKTTALYMPILDSTPTDYTPTTTQNQENQNGRKKDP